MPFEPSRHLAVVAVGRREEVGTDEDQDDVRPLELLEDLAVEIGSRFDPAVVEGLDGPLALQHGERGFEPIPKSFVDVRVGEEDDRHELLVVSVVKAAVLHREPRVAIG